MPPLRPDLSDVERRAVLRSPVGFGLYAFCDRTAPPASADLIRLVTAHLHRLAFAGLHGGRRDRFNENFPLP